MSRAELQAYLEARFSSWSPRAPAVVARRTGDVTLSWLQDGFPYLQSHLLYRIEKNDKLPKWVTVYSGGLTSKRIDNLAPRHPHKFRLKVILKAEAVSRLADLAVEYYGDEDTVYEEMEQLHESDDNDEQNNKSKQSSEDRSDSGDSKTENENKIKESIESNDKSKGDADSNNVKRNQLSKADIKKVVEAVKLVIEMKKTVEGNRTERSDKPRWLESQWSPETWTNTVADGTSPVCFCMAVKCGYLKQVQAMVEERPELVEIVNSQSGHTPLATAVSSGDVSTVRLLLSLGAAVNQPSLAGQTPLLLAVRAADLALVDLLLEKGADITARDCNGLRAEHYAVDSCDLDTLRYILDRGDVSVRDNNGWTPLFRAITQDARPAAVAELMRRGSEAGAVDAAGLPLLSAAKLLRDRHGRPRASILRLVDEQFPRDNALAHFTRLSRKIHHVRALLRRDST